MFTMTKNVYMHIDSTRNVIKAKELDIIWKYAKCLFHGKYVYSALSNSMCGIKFLGGIFFENY